MLVGLSGHWSEEHFGKCTFYKHLSGSCQSFGRSKPFNQARMVLCSGLESILLEAD